MNDALSPNVEIDLKDLLRTKSVDFWPQLRRQTKITNDPSDLLRFAALRKKAAAIGFAETAAAAPIQIRLAVLGAFTQHVMTELLRQVAWANAIELDLFQGDFDNDRPEILEESSSLYEFRPDFIFLAPSPTRSLATGRLGDSWVLVEENTRESVRELLELITVCHQRSKAEVILCNMVPPAFIDPGPLRTREAGSLWNRARLFNLELGRNLPSFATLCDLEFLAARQGLESSEDSRAWFESKQPGSVSFQLQIAREVLHLMCLVRGTPRKVLVLDLDNTLWGGVIGDDGLEGIELGDTSPRGEAFKAFQRVALQLKDRGVLLAICSKNEMQNALEPFQKHPEMILREADIVSFKANWLPKPDNLAAMAHELNLGLDSFVFVDDNPAEIEIVRQTLPDVATICLGDDPAQFTSRLLNARHFETRALTQEDRTRSELYQREAKRDSLRRTAVDMPTFLASLEMKAQFRSHTPQHAIDEARIVQLINKSNQFNLTTIRRSPADLATLIARPDIVCFSARLHDRFGDYGLIAVVILLFESDACVIDTWLMSCRVLSRQMEEETLNEILRLAKSRGATRIRGLYRPTPKNGLVRDHYSRLGFTKTAESSAETCYEMEIAGTPNRKTTISVEIE